jgi:RND superfamily putative drug exporter
MYDTAPIIITLQTPDHSRILTTENLTKVASLSQWLRTRPHVTQVTDLLHLPAIKNASTLSEGQLISLYATGTYLKNSYFAASASALASDDTTLISVQSNAGIDSDEGKALIVQIRAHDRALAQGLNVNVGGIQATYSDFEDVLYHNFPRTILFVVGITYLLLLIIFRSVLLPLKAVLVNIISLGASYGVLVSIFQWGNFKDVLGFTSNGFIDSLIPILLFCILFGLSMDYEVFLLTRIREEWLRTQDNTQAVARGLERVGGVITSAALLFVVVTVAFVFTRLLLSKELGLGMTVAILIDATIVRILLVPATMRLLGRWNWWPGYATIRAQSKLKNKQ